MMANYAGEMEMFRLLCQYQDEPSKVPSMFSEVLPLIIFFIPERSILYVFSPQVKLQCWRGVLCVDESLWGLGTLRKHAWLQGCLG